MFLEWLKFSFHAEGFTLLYIFVELNVKRQNKGFRVHPIDLKFPIYCGRPRWMVFNSPSYVLCCPAVVPFYLSTLTLFYLIHHIAPVATYQQINACIFLQCVSPPIAPDDKNHLVLFFSTLLEWVFGCKLIMRTLASVECIRSSWKSKENSVFFMLFNLTFYTCLGRFLSLIPFANTQLYMLLLTQS